MATVAGAALAGSRLDPVRVALERAPLGVDDKQCDGRIGRNQQLEGTIRFDRGVTKDLLLLELRLADRAAQAHRARRRRDRARGADESRRRAAIGGIRRVLHLHQIRNLGPRVVRIGRLRLGDRGRASGRMVRGAEHRVAHATEFVGVVHAAHLEQCESLLCKRRIDRCRIGRVRLNPRLQCNRIGEHEAGRGCGDDQECLLRRIEHVDRIRGRHVVLQRIGLHLCRRAILVGQPRDLFRRQGCARDHHAVARDLARRKREQHTVGAVPQRIRRADASVRRNAAFHLQGLRRRLMLPSDLRHRRACRRVLLRVVGCVDEHQRPAFVSARQRHQVRRHEPFVRTARIHVARMQEAVAFAVRAVQHEHIGAVRLHAEDLEVVATRHVVPARKHDVAVGTHDGIAIVALIERNLLDPGPAGVHRVQIEDPFALVFVEREIGSPECLRRLRFGLPVGRKHETAAGGQIRGIDVVVLCRTRQATQLPARESARGHVVFPDVPAAGARGLTSDGRRIRRRAAQRKHDLLAVV